jgi:ubiquinone/menaquinone biosynthesis C-methylase UbiE
MLQRLAAALMSRPFFYSLVQTLSGGRVVARRVREAVGSLPAGRALDVGSSSGGTARALGMQPSLLVCFDNDIIPLADRVRRGNVGVPVQGDAARLPFIDKAFDVSLCTAVSHHLDDDSLPAALAEIARVTSKTFLFFDATKEDARWMSRILWRFDRGRHPRRESDLRHRLERSFRAKSTLVFAVLHRYFLFVGEPRR